MRAWWFRVNGDEKGKKSKGNRDNGHQNISSGGVGWGGERGRRGGGMGVRYIIIEFASLGFTLVV